VAEDFLVFCKLAVKAGVLPPSWDWPGFMKQAQSLLPYAFEKSDAQEKWGGENIFAAGEWCGTEFKLHLRAVQTEPLAVWL
jgi:hypothetical protein